MPIPAPRVRSSSLTKSQRKAEIAAIYGVPMPQNLTEPEYERMRELLKEHDATKPKEVIHDLNHPPQQAYHFQQFPMMVYDLTHSTRDKVIAVAVKNHAQLKEALEAGWSETAPEYREEHVGPLSASLQMEADTVQDQIDEIKKRRGRPKHESAA